MNESVALVTGGSRGIGRAICEALARQGWQVVAVARDRQALAATTEAIAAAGGRCQHLVCDARDRNAIELCVTAVERQHGKIDLLVNNAGGGTVGRPLGADEMPDQEWIDMIDLNLTSVYRFCRAAIPGMKARNSGCIVNVSVAVTRRVTPSAKLKATTSESGTTL